jgi:trimeric autotransporter adhesin
MANVLDRNFDFATNGTVTAAGLHNLIDETNIYAGLISTQEEKTTVGTSDLLLVADSSSIGSPQIAANRTTVYNLFDDALTSGTYANAQLSGNLTYGTATGNRTISTSANITTGTILNLTAGTTTSTLGTITNLSSGTTNSTSVIATSGTIGTLNSTTGTIATINSTTGTIASLNSTTGTIGNLTTTLTGDLTISAGVATASTATVAKLAVAQEYTAAHNFNATTLTSGTSIAWDLSANQVARLVLSTNGTMADASNKVDGSVYILLVTQGTGSNTLAWNATYKWPGGTAPTLTTGSAKSDIFTFISNGTSLFGVASQNYS